MAIKDRPLDERMQWARLSIFGYNMTDEDLDNAIEMVDAVLAFVDDQFFGLFRTWLRGKQSELYGFRRAREENRKRKEQAI